jgi:two-component system, sensor histidine kinase and response regulator
MVEMGIKVFLGILDFSKIEARKLELDAIPFALRESVEETIKAHGARANAKGLELICDIDARVPDGWIGDSLRLRQILTNLVGNGEMPSNSRNAGRSPYEWNDG